ncbi:MAG: RidA family protein, partial [Ureaplasma sp.]|nr:RidA family protein [Ureaplasma sp.]
KDYKPALTLIAIKDIPMNASIQIEAVITCGEGTIPNAPQVGDLIKVVKNTNNAPTNSYSNQTVAFSHYNHLSAQLPIDSKTGKIVSGGIKEQLNQSLRNVKNILESIDVPFDDIVKVNIYTTEISQLEIIKETYKTFFPDSAIARFVNYLPALTINPVVALPMDAKVQVEVTVSHGDGTPPQLVEDRHGIVIEANNTKSVFINSLSSQTVAFSHYNNISEQLPIDANGKVISSDINQQLSQCIENLKAIVESVDHKLADVVKLNIYVENIDSINGFETVLKKYFSTLPAGRVVAVDTLNCKDALVKIDAIVSNAEGTPPTNK